MGKDRLLHGEGKVRKRSGLCYKMKTLEQTRTLQSRDPQPTPTAPQRAPRHGVGCHLCLLLPRRASGSPHLLRQPGGTEPRAPREGEAARPREGAERWLREPNQKFHLEAARRQGLSSSLRRQREGTGGIGARALT